MSLVGQWVSEAKSKLTDGAALKIYEYYGSKRCRDNGKHTQDLVCVCGRGGGGEGRVCVCACVCVFFFGLSLSCASAVFNM